MLLRISKIHSYICSWRIKSDLSNKRSTLHGHPTSAHNYDHIASTSNVSFQLFKYSFIEKSSWCNKIQRSISRRYALVRVVFFAADHSRRKVCWFRFGYTRWRWVTDWNINFMIIPIYTDDTNTWYDCMESLTSFGEIRGFVTKHYTSSNITNHVRFNPFRCSWSYVGLFYWTWTCPCWRRIETDRII